MDRKSLEAVAEAALTEALLFFAISPEIEVSLKYGPHPEMGDAPATCHLSFYLTADIHIVPDLTQTGAEVWRNVGHEVAHLVTRELSLYQAQQSVREARHLEVGLEHATTRLERLFMRECPYPQEKFGEP